MDEELGLPEGWLNDAVKGFLAGIVGERRLDAAARFLLEAVLGDG